MSHIYKIKHKFKKHPELLEKYGFARYESQDDEEVFYATHITLPWDCSIVTYLRAAFEKIYSKANEEEKKEFADYSFTKSGRLKVTKKIKKEFSECQLCFSVNGLGSYVLFINAPDKVEYYGDKVLEECAKELIETLKKDKVIYRAKAYEPKKTVLI